jgi:hypothetical protein
MKQIFKYILIGLSLFSVSTTALAQHVANGIGTNKTVSAEDSDGNYTITLETWATGGTTVVTSAAPADIVLVLDLSQSMTDEYGDYVYTARDSQGYSYNGYGNNTYYYLHTDGNYYPVQRQTQGNRPTYYRLRYQVGSQSYYLSGTGTTTTAPTNVTSNTATIWTGVLYTRAQGTRLTALQGAVADFLEVIYHNDNYEDKTNDKYRSAPLGNRISIVTFGGPRGNGSETDVTRVVSGLTNVSNSDRSKNDAMIADLLALTNSSINNSAHYGTYADEGMVFANSVLAGIPASRKEDSSRTVVLFTDGAPGSGPGWTTGDGANASSTTANGAIAAAKTAKSKEQGHDATVFTVVLGDIANTTMQNYLDYTSSNYPEASSLSSPGTAATGDTDYSLAAGNDLSGVFTTIAHASGGSERPVDSSTQVRDVVSSSFVIPDGFNTNDVVFKVFDVVSINDNTWVENTTYDKSGISAVIGTNAEGKSTLTVEGFDYSLDDNPKNSGNGNWVGPRYIGGQYVDKGRKLQIQFKIKSIGGATGGDGTNTNDPTSGVYVKDAQGNYVCLNNYDMPHADLPVILVIKKTGLKHGESATFEIERCRPLHWDESKTLEENKAAMEYNAIGKPKPDGNWDDWSKVILTNKGNDRAEVTKTMMALDPHYIYRVSEDAWGWAYEMTGATVGGEIPNTSTVEVNPFTFENKDKKGVVKHAEAVTINHFGYTIQTGEFQGQQEEHYKSSKLKSF